MYNLSAPSFVILATIAETIFLFKRFPNRSAQAEPVQILFLIFTINLIIWRFYRAVIYPEFISTLRHLPKAKRRWPLIGYGPAQFSNSRGQIFLQMANTVPNDGLIRFQGFLDTEHLLLTNPEALNEVLIKRSYDFIKPPGAVKIFNQFLGRTFLFVTEGIQHREAKRIVQPPFSFRQVQDMYPVFWAKATDMTNSIELSAPRDEQGALVADVELWAHEATLDAIFGTMFGQHFLDSPHKNEVLKLYETLLSPRWDVRLYFMITAFLPLWTLKLIPGDISQRVDAASSSLRQAVKALIEDRKGDAEKKSHKDIVIQLIERDYFTDEELVSNILGLLIAGIEPTTSGFVWAIWYLAMHPTWQARLRDEIRANIPHRFLTNDSASFDAASTLEKLPILVAVCNESLRLMPPSPISNRVTKFDTSVLGQPVPAGTKLFIASYTANRFEKFWGPTAETFDPSRWLGGHGRDKKADGSSNYGFMPFLHGPRKCIGHIYATYEIRLFLAAFVGRFEFEMADKGEAPIPAGVMTIKPKNGLKLRMRPVKPG